MAKHVGLKMARLPHGRIHVSVRGQHVGMVMPRAVGKYEARIGNKPLGFHKTARQAAEHVARASIKPAGKSVVKLKRPKSIFKVRSHPTQSLGV